MFVKSCISYLFGLFVFNKKQIEYCKCVHGEVYDPKHIYVKYILVKQMFGHKHLIRE